MIIALILAACEDEHYTDRFFDVGKFYAFRGPDEQDVEFVFAFYYYVGDGQARLDYGAAVSFAVEEFFEKYIFICIELSREDVGYIAE